MSRLSPTPVQTHFTCKTTIALWNQNSKSGFGLNLSKLEHMQCLYENFEYMVFQSIFLNFKGFGVFFSPPKQSVGKRGEWNMDKKGVWKGKVCEKKETGTECFTWKQFYPFRTFFKFMILNIKIYNSWKLNFKYHL